MSELSLHTKRLCRISLSDAINPYDIEWPVQINMQGWYMSPELISLYGTRTFDQLSEDQQKLLSFHEAVNFFSLNVHGEKPLVEGLARRMYRATTLEITPYLHHFIDEENRHMVYFGNFCLRYAGKIYADKKISFPRDDNEPGEEDFLFFAKVLIFEELVDAYNIRMASDKRLEPIARRINSLHHKDEARHLVFGRELVKTLFKEYSRHWRGETVSSIRKYLAAYLTATWREYYNPAVYKDSGLTDPEWLSEIAFQSESGRQHRRKISEPLLCYLLKNGILSQEPPL